MNRRILSSLGFVAVISLVAPSLGNAQDLAPIKLPAPQMDGGKPLMQVLKQRLSAREFSPDKVPAQTLANLLWAAWGINRPDGRRTAPSASNQQEIEIEKFSRQTAFNIFPQVGPLGEGGSEEESDIERELPKILGLDKLAVTVTAAMVPIFCGASAAVNLETEQPATLEQVRELLEQAPGVLVVDRPEAEEFPDTLLAMSREEILVGRLRRDPTAASGFNFWISMDNLRKGSSLNMVQIAEAVLLPERKAPPAKKE